jgi:hypothetical protein
MGAVLSPVEVVDIRLHGVLPEESQVKRTYEDSVSEDVASLSTLKDRLLRRKVSSEVELRTLAKEKASP